MGVTMAKNKSASSLSSCSSVLMAKNKSAISSCSSLLVTKNKPALSSCSSQLVTKNKPALSSCSSLLMTKNKPALSSCSSLLMTKNKSAISSCCSLLMTKNKPALSSCSSLLMSFLFALSALVQLNDPDWYFWLPLYSGAFVVNLFKLSKASGALNQVAKVSLVGGSLLFIKVVMEDLMNGIAGLWSIDMRERVVREKIGSALVLLSMLLHLKHSHVQKLSQKQTTEQPFAFIEIGMTLLAAGSYGLSIYALAFVNKEEMIFS